MILVLAGRVPAQSPGDWAPAKPSSASPSAPPSTPAPKTTPDKEKLKKEGQELFKKRPQTGGDASADAKGWAVVIAVFKGDDREQAAAQKLASLRTEGGLPGAFSARRNAAIIIAVGDFASPTADDAKAELARIQSIEINGTKPYAAALLAPPLDFKMVGSMPQYNLLKAKEQFGADALYTLQVGAYGRLDLAHPTEADLADVRRAAEQAALKLRQEGEQAWYFHGPSMSMVCVGVFTQDDFDPQTPKYNSARLRDAKLRNPLNLYNGQGTKVKVNKGQEELQASRLVAIPKK